MTATGSVPAGTRVGRYEIVSLLRHDVRPEPLVERVVRNRIRTRVDERLEQQERLRRKRQRLAIAAKLAQLRVERERAEPKRHARSIQLFPSFRTGLGEVLTGSLPMCLRWCFSVREGVVAAMPDGMAFTVQAP